jgi:hypothetical protein
MAKQSAAKAADELLSDLGGSPEATQEEPERAAEPATPAVQESPVKATRKPKVKPVSFDAASGVLTINDQHGSFETSLMGINPRIEWQLAAIGLASLLKGRVDKDKVIENIRAGQFGGKRKQKYPATVIAYANYQNITVEEAWTQWQSLSVPDRMAIRSLPKVRLELAKLADAAESKS